MGAQREVIWAKKVVRDDMSGNHCGSCKNAELRPSFEVRNCFMGPSSNLKWPFSLMSPSSQGPLRGQPVWDNFPSFYKERAVKWEEEWRGKGRVGGKKGGKRKKAGKKPSLTPLTSLVPRFLTIISIMRSPVTASLLYSHFCNLASVSICNRHSICKGPQRPRKKEAKDWWEC